MSPIRRFVRIFAVIIALIATLLAITVAILPFVIKSEPLKQKIEDLVHSKTGLHVELGEIKLVYLPTPCVEFDRIDVNREQLSFKAVDVRLYPNLMSLLGLDKEGLPVRSLSFHKGILSKEISLVDGEIALDGDLVRFSTQCNIKATCDFSLAGSYERHTKHISMEVVGGKTDIGALVKAFLKKDRFKGTLANSFKFTMDADLTGSGPYKIKIASLDLEHPHLIAQGAIEVQKEAHDLFLDVDVTARAVDVSDIRPFLRQVLPNEKAIKETVEIVRGGQLESFRLKFNGMKADLKHFKNYEIAATGKDVPIYIPKIDLLINRVNGSIEIKKEVLTGQGLKAHLRHTSGKNCSIRLDLGGKHKKMAFRGELHATSDDILWAVKKFVKERTVLKWADNITSTSGGALGLLELKGPLKHLTVSIKAHPKSINVRLKGVRDEIYASGGDFSLNTKSKRIRVHSVSGGYGDIKWNAMDGEIKWGKEHSFDVLLKNVKLDLKALQDVVYSQKSGVRLRKKLREISGILSLKKAHFKGSIKRPQALSYEITLGGGMGKVDSPLLPMEASFKGPFGTIANDSIRLHGLTLNFSDNTTLDVTSFRLTHTKGHIRTVDTALTGQVGNMVGNWAIKKAKVPEEFWPKLPLDVKALKISVRPPGEIGVVGTFGRRYKKKQNISVSLTLRKRRHVIHLKKLTIQGPNSNATMEFAVEEASQGKRDRKNGSLRFIYKGKLVGDELNTLFKQNKLLMGELSGELSLAIGGVEHPHIRGTLDARGLLWNWGVKRPIFIEALSTRTQDAHLEITQCILQEGPNTIKGTGLLHGSTKGLSINFNAIDGEIDVDSVISLLGHGPPKGLDKKGKGHPGVIPQRSRQGLKWPRLIRDIRLKFNIREAYYNKKAIEAPSGVLVLSEDGRLTLDLYSSLLCGLHTALSLDYVQHEPKAIMRVWTEDKGTPPDFASTLPCLGVTKDLINGPIGLDVNLKGTPGDWEEGHFKLKGGPGIIKRSYVIAKIFSIINVTGLFNKNLFKADLPYSLLEVNGHVQGKKVAIERLVLKAEGLNFFGRGEVLLDKGTIDLFVLVSPFKTFDYILSKIPILGYAIGGKNRTILTIPLKVSGPLEDPGVTVLHPEAIGKGMLDLFKNILSIPIRVVVPEGIGELE